MKPPQIQKMGFGNIVIDGVSYGTDNIVLYWDSIETIEKSHEIKKSDFEHLMLREPDVVVLGIGFNSIVKVDDEVKSLAKQEGIELYILPTEDALKKFQELVRKGKRAAAIIHPTC